MISKKKGVGAYASISIHSVCKEWLTFAKENKTIVPVLASRISSS